MSTELDKRRVPDAAEVRTILEKYFEGPITDAQVALVDRKLRETVRDATTMMTEIRAFDANAGRFHGRLWREELGVGPRAPDPKDFVPWFASTLDGFPPARPYCPPALVGVWQGDGGRWTFAANGAFSTTQSPFTAFDRWYCRIRGDKVGDLLLLAKQLGGPDQLVVSRVTADELDIRWGAKHIILRRVS